MAPNPFPKLLQNHKISVPTDRRFVQINEHLLGLQVFLESPRTKFPAEPRLLVPAPRRLDIRRLHVIDPNNPCTERFHDPECLVNVACPDCTCESIRRVV